jgi:DNA polymerase-3 subunit delta'
MLRARTRGQAAAIGALDGLRLGRLPHAILLVGPAGSGKTTLALDCAAALLCEAADPADRPCRSCRTCRMVDSGNHPDLHRLAPSGAGAQIGIGGPDRPRGVRDLVGELALLPVEGGLRIAIIEEAHRLNEDAQSALLKTLEEPAPGVVLLLCAEEEERLLPTVRSRCARIRLGPVPVRDLEAWLVELGAAGPPRAGRLARISGGRPGLALAYARAPEAEKARGEIGRELLDLLAVRPAEALGKARDLLARALDLAAALDAGARAGGPVGDAGRSRGGRRASGAARAGAASAAGPAEALPTEDSTGASDANPDAPAAIRLAPQERRRAALLLIDVWREVARDLALVELGEARRVRDIGLLDDLEATANRIRSLPRSPGRSFLGRLNRAAELVAGNVGPELAIDVLVLGWRSAGAGDRPVQQR